MFSRDFARSPYIQVHPTVDLALNFNKKIPLYCPTSLNIFEGGSLLSFCTVLGSLRLAQACPDLLRLVQHWKNLIVIYHTFDHLGGTCTPPHQSVTFETLKTSVLCQPGMLLCALKVLWHDPTFHFY